MYIKWLSISEVAPHTHTQRSHPSGNTPLHHIGHRIKNHNIKVAINTIHIFFYIIKYKIYIDYKRYWLEGPLGSQKQLPFSPSNYPFHIICLFSHFTKGINNQYHILHYFPILLKTHLFAQKNSCTVSIVQRPEKRKEES